MVGGDRWCALKSRSQPVIYSDLPLAHILCPAVPFKTAPALECFLPNISSTLCFPIRRALLRLVAHCLPCRERVPAEKLSLSQPNRQSKLEMLQQEVEKLRYSFSSQTGAFIVTSWWEVTCLLPTYDVQPCLSTLHQQSPALECFLSKIFEAHYASPSAERC